jgi:hypothetical protein
VNAECAEIEGAEDQIDKEDGKYHERRPLRRHEQPAEAFNQADQQTGKANDQRPALCAAKDLAAQTTNALAEIKDKTLSVGHVIEVVQSANEAMAKSMVQVSTISGAISDAVHQQNFVARQIAETVDGAAVRTGEVSDSIAGVSELVHRSGRGADQVLAAAAELSRQAAALTRDAGVFVGRIRAA